MRKILILITISLLLFGCSLKNISEPSREEIEIVPENIEHNYLSNLDILKIRNLELTKEEQFNPDKDKCFGIYLEDFVDGEIETYTINFYCLDCNNTKDYNTKNIRMSTYYNNYRIYSCEYMMWK